MTETSRVDPLVKRLREASSLTFDDWTTVGPYNDYRTAPEAADIIEQLAANIEALTTQLAEDADARKQIDHRLEELVGQVDALTAERDRLKQEVDQFRRVNDGLQDAMLVAEAETRMTMAELADWTARAEAAEAETRLLMDELADTVARECRIYESHAEAAEADNARLREALEWYGEHARRCQMVWPERDKGRAALATDGGQRAHDALNTGKETE